MFQPTREKLDLVKSQFVSERETPASSAQSAKWGWKFVSEGVKSLHSVPVGASDSVAVRVVHWTTATSGGWHVLVYKAKVQWIFVCRVALRKGAKLLCDSPANPLRDSRFNVKHFTAEERARFTSDFRIFLEMLCTDTLPKELEDVSLRHPIELVDMIVAFTNNDNLKNIRNEVAISELEGKVLNMGNIFDSIAANAATKATIDEAKYYYRKGMHKDIVVDRIAEKLGISLDEAKEIFEKEVLMLETV